MAANYYCERRIFLLSRPFSCRLRSRGPVHAGVSLSQWLSSVQSEGDRASPDVIMSKVASLAPGVAIEVRDTGGRRELEIGETSLNDPAFWLRRFGLSTANPPH
jgi:hypothetical protein